MASNFTLGLDYGTNSVRALIVETATGREVASAITVYPQGEQGVILDPQDPNLARQHPEDYLTGLEASVKQALKLAAKDREFKPERIIGIGVDTTGSTPLPVDNKGRPLAMSKKFARHPAAMAWLWKDHTGHAEAEEITAAAEKSRPQFLAKCGGRYSSEWFWSKILHCARTAPEVFDAAYTWVECADWIPAVLTGTDAPEQLKRGVCAAGHKAMYHRAWGGYPDAEFLGALDSRLVRVRQTLPAECFHVGHAAGQLTRPWAKRLGLKPGIPVAVGAFDAHLGAVGSGIAPGVLVKIIGTSTCDILVSPLATVLPDIPGLCGIVPESVLPGMYGLEAGQSAVGDIFNWFVNVIAPGGARQGSHEALTKGAAALKPGQSGLLGLDWHNGNRTILVDQRLTGLILGLTLHSTPAEIYRALIESTAYGARRIIERFEEYGVKVERVVNCGGIAAKNPLVMQIYADVLGRPMQISRSDQTCALGAAMAGAVVAGKAAGGHENFAAAAQAMTGVKAQSFQPIPENQAVYERLYQLYRRLHDAFGVRGTQADLAGVMKELLNIRDATR
ncbi:MAG: ribulokinase [Verrucomicrobiae bacterium]|nr:ribulokinase [Verrucomicrobiae bacterium]